VAAHAVISQGLAGAHRRHIGPPALALAHAGPDEQSLFGGLVNTAIQVGGGLGLAVMTVTATALTMGDDLLPGFRAAFWTATGIDCSASPSPRSSSARTAARLPPVYDDHSQPLSRAGAGAPRAT